MASPASVVKHPIHPMLIPFPIALWIFSFVCDTIYALGWGDHLWNEMAFYSMAGGVLGALLAAVPGYVDYRSLTGSTVKRIGRLHMGLNLFIVVLFTVNLWLRVSATPRPLVPFVLSLIGISMLAVSGWLGGELVYVHRVAVESESGPFTRKDPSQVA